MLGGSAANPKVLGQALGFRILVLVGFGIFPACWRARSRAFFFQCRLPELDVL